MAFPHNGTGLPQHFPNPHQYMQQQGLAFNTQQPGGYAVYQQQLPTPMHQSQFHPTANGIGSFPPGVYQNGILNGNHPAVVDIEALAQEMAADPMFDEDQYIEPYPMTPESAERNDIAERAKEIRHETRRERKRQNPLATVIVQDTAGKILTGKCAYDIVAVIEPGGDPMRMSDGIFQVLHPNGSLRIAKRLKVNTPERMSRARAERDALLRLKVMESPHINYLYEVCWPNGVNSCLLILDHCDGGSIESLIVKHQREKHHFSEGFMWHTLRHMCSALSATHNGIKDPFNKTLQLKDWDTIVHMDIKPANVFWSMQRGKGLEDDEHPTIILGDFGCAVTQTEVLQGKYPKLGQPFGTEGWFPPEAIAREGEWAGRYGRPTDIWQVGALITCMCRLSLHPDPIKINTAKPCGDHYGPELNKLVATLLRKNPMQRPSAVDVVEVMRRWSKVRLDDDE